MKLRNRRRVEHSRTSIVRRGTCRLRSAMYADTPKEVPASSLGVAVLLDAARVRLLLLPVLLRLMGKWAWYLPRWAHRVLPDVTFGHA